MTRIDASYAGSVRPADGDPAMRGDREALGSEGAAALADAEPTTGNSALTNAKHLVFSLQIGGWSEVEAGNIVARLLGIRPVHGGWRAPQIEHLRFLRALVETGRIAH